MNKYQHAKAIINESARKANEVASLGTVIRVLVEVTIEYLKVKLKLSYLRMRYK